MSQYYLAGDAVLWNPSTGISRLFLDQVRFSESELSMASGIGSMEADECQVDLPVFDAFARFLAADQRLRHHPVWRTLAEGLVITVLALAERAGLLEVWAPTSDPLEAHLRERARALAPSLSR